MAKEHFNEAYEHTGGAEGFYSNDPKDAGGETLYGVARNYWPNWGGFAIVDEYKKKPGFPENMRNDQRLKDLRKAFYKASFWDVLKLDSVSDKMICMEMYDTAVNQGTGRAARYIQTALNVSNDRGKYYADVAIDGIIGAGTVAAINKHPRPITLVKLLNVMQGNHYIEQCLKNPTQEAYLNGWFTRVFEHPLK